MRTQFRAALLFLALVSMVGCGSNPAPPSGSSPSQPSGPSGSVPTAVPATLVWTDPNTLVPVCSGNLVNCKDHFLIHDKTTGVITTVGITGDCLKVPNLSDGYEIQTDGYDGNGLAVSSAWGEFPLTPVSGTLHCTNL